MADLQELLSSISDEDMAKLKNVAESLMGNTVPKEQPKKTAPSLPFDEKMISKLMSVMGQMNKEDSRTRLILDLKPLLNEDRRKKADDAIKFLQLMHGIRMMTTKKVRLLLIFILQQDMLNISTNEQKTTLMFKKQFVKHMI